MRAEMQLNEKGEAKEEVQQGGNKGGDVRVFVHVAGRVDERRQETHISKVFIIKTPHRAG